MTGHDVRKVQQAPRRVPGPVHMDMHPAGMRRIRFCTSRTQVTDDLLQQGHLLPGQHRGDQLGALSCAAGRDGRVALDFPDPRSAPATSPMDSALVQVVTRTLNNVGFVRPGFQGFLDHDCGLSAGDIVHFDLNAELLIQDFVHLYAPLVVLPVLVEPDCRDRLAFRTVSVQEVGRGFFLVMTDPQTAKQARALSAKVMNFKFFHF